MAVTSKARTLGYDNIEAGGASGTERTIAGATPPDFTTWGNTENISVGTDYSADENLVARTVSLLANERLGA